MKQYIINLMEADIEQMKAHVKKAMPQATAGKFIVRVQKKIALAEKHLEKVKSHNLKFIKP